MNPEAIYHCQVSFDLLDRRMTLTAHEDNPLLPEDRLLTRPRNPKIERAMTIHGSIYKNHGDKGFDILLARKHFRWGEPGHVVAQEILVRIEKTLPNLRDSDLVNETQTIIDIAECEDIVVPMTPKRFIQLLGHAVDCFVELPGEKPFDLAGVSYRNGIFEPGYLLTSTQLARLICTDCGGEDAGPPIGIVDAGSSLASRPLMDSPEERHRLMALLREHRNSRKQLNRHAYATGGKP